MKLFGWLVTVATFALLPLGCDANAGELGPAPLPMSLEVGTGSNVKLVRIGVQSRSDHRWLARDGKHLSASWDFSLAQWRASAHQNIAGRRQDIAAVGITPVFRFQSDSTLRWYLEGGIGIHLLSKLYDNNDNKLSTHGQFGDHIGAGYVFRNRWELALKLQHFSNGGVKKPNSGANFIVFKLARAM